MVENTNTITTPRFITAEQAMMLINIMDEIEKNIAAIHPRYDKYFLAWDELAGFLIEHVSVEQPAINEQSAQEEIPVDEEEENQIIDDSLVDVPVEEPKEEITVDEEIQEITNRAIPNVQKKFLNPTITQKPPIMPPKLKPPMVSALVRPIPVIGASGQRASRPVHIPPKINEDIDILDDGEQ